MAKKYNFKQAAERARAIRRANVQRHVTAQNKNKLREDIARDVANRQYTMEHNMLLEASLRHSGLDVPGLKRLNELAKKIKK